MMTIFMLFVGEYLKQSKYNQDPKYLLLSVNVCYLTEHSCLLK